MRRPEAAVGAVCVVDGALLLVRRGQDPEAGRWSLPGGRVEWGESLEQALRREVEEETGLRVTVGALVGWAERRGEQHHFVILDFSVSPAGARRGRPPLLAGGDATDAVWLALDEVRAQPLVSGLADFLAEHGVLAAP